MNPNAPKQPPNYWADLDRDIPFDRASVNVLVRNNADSVTGKDYLVQCNQLPGTMTLELDSVPRTQEIASWLIKAAVIPRFDPTNSVNRYELIGKGSLGMNQLDYPSKKLLTAGAKEYLDAMSPTGLVAVEVQNNTSKPIDLGLVIPNLADQLANNLIHSAKSAPANSAISREKLSQWSAEIQAEDGDAGEAPRFTG